MWSPTDIRRRAPRVVLVCLAALMLASCGYGFGNDAGSVLEAPAPGVLPTLKIKSVDNPTLYPWLSHVVRSEVRDELAARGIARWVDSGKADYELSLKVDSFTFRSWMTDIDDVTMLYSASMLMEGIVYRGDSNEEVWRSGQVAYSQTYEQVQERTAAGDLVRELARLLVNRMRQSF